MPAGRTPAPPVGRRDHAGPGRVRPRRHARPAHVRPRRLPRPDDEHRHADERLEQHAADRDVALRPRRRRHEPGRAGAAARRRQRDADGFERRPPRRRLPRRHVRRLDRRAADRRPDDGAARRPRALRLAGLLPDAALDRQLLRRARRLGRHEPAGDARAAPRRGRRAGDEHAAPLLEPRPAALLQRQSERRRTLGRADDRRRRRRGLRRGGDRLHRPGGRRSRRGDPHGLDHVTPPAARGRRSTCSSASHRCRRRAARSRTRGVWKSRLAVAPARSSSSSRPRTGSASSRSTTTAASYYRLGARRRPPRRRSRSSRRRHRHLRRQPSVTAALTTAGGAPLGGKTVTIGVGGSAAIGVTGADGRVTLAVPLTAVPADHKLVASFGGDARTCRLDASAPFSIAKAPSSLSPFTQLAVVTAVGATGVRHDALCGGGRQAAAAAAADGDLHAHRAGRDENVLDDHRLSRPRDAAADGRRRRHLRGQRLVRGRRDLHRRLVPERS